MHRRLQLSRTLNQGSYKRVIEGTYFSNQPNILPTTLKDISFRTVNISIWQVLTDANKGLLIPTLGNIHCDQEATETEPKTPW